MTSSSSTTEPRQWEARKSLSAARCYAVAMPYFGPIPMLRGQSANVIFLIGGCDRQGQPVNNVDMYLPDKDFWFPLQPMQVARANPICAILNRHYILALGGVGNDPPQAPSNAVELYDIRQNKWFKLANMTEPLMGMAHVVRGNQLFIFGGMKINTNPTDCARRLTLKIKGEEEQQHAHSVSGSTSLSSLAIQSTSSMQSLVNSESDVTLTWESLPMMPTARYAATALNFDKYIAVVGGRVGKTPISSFEVFDFAQGVWRIFPDHPGHRVFQQQ